MITENFKTEVTEFDRDWIDKYSLVSNAYDWAVKNLAPGHRLIGTRLLTFANRLDLYKFDIRNHPEKGVTVECETPARCPTVIRVSSRHMIVQELGTNEIVQKYIPCVEEDGIVVWRQWHRRLQQYHLEVETPALNYNIFLLQCNQVVVRLATDAGSRDWFGDIKKRVHLANMREDTPKAVRPLLRTLHEDVELFYQNPLVKPKLGAPIDRGPYLDRYRQLLDESAEFIVAAGAGNHFRR